VELKLTPEQQEKILEVLRKHRNDFEETFRNLGEARRKLEDTLSRDNATEADVREAHKAVAAAQEDLAVLRMKIRREIMPILTEQQRAMVQSWLAERGAMPFGRKHPRTP